MVTGLAVEAELEGDPEKVMQAVALDPLTSACLTLSEIREVIQSLLASCRLQGVDPYVYLVDVLQRVSSHPAKDVHLLTPRLWKERFAADPMRSDLDLPRNRDPGG